MSGLWTLAPFGLAALFALLCRFGKRRGVWMVLCELSAVCAVLTGLVLGVSLADLALGAAGLFLICALGGGGKA